VLTNDFFIAGKDLARCFIESIKFINDMYGKATQKFCEIATYFNHMPCILGLCAQDFNATSKHDIIVRIC
jgi:hypothetical protein